MEEARRDIKIEADHLRQSAVLLFLVAVSRVTSPAGIHLHITSRPFSLELGVKTEIFSLVLLHQVLPSPHPTIMFTYDHAFTL